MKNFSTQQRNEILFISRTVQILLLTLMDVIVIVFTNVLQCLLNNLKQEIIKLLHLKITQHNIFTSFTIWVLSKTCGWLLQKVGSTSLGGIVEVGVVLEIVSSCKLCAAPSSGSWCKLCVAPSNGSLCKLCVAPLGGSLCGGNCGQCGDSRVWKIVWNLD